MNDPETICRDVYEETRAFYARISSDLGEAAHGFRILYGQPLVSAPIIFLGYQPGGSSADIREAHHTGWPERCDYAFETWPLARRMRTIWGTPLLDQCTGLNLIFFRASSVHAWHAIAPNVREQIERFCRERVERIVRALAPERMVIIGLGTFDRLVDGRVILSNNGRVLAKQGTLWGIPAIGSIHLSGARISRSDLDQLTQFLRSPNPA